jgi:hypothetical protein
MESEKTYFMATILLLPPILRKKKLEKEDISKLNTIVTDVTRN